MALREAAAVTPEDDPEMARRKLGDLVVSVVAARQVAEARAQQDARWRSMIAGIVADLPFDDASGAWRFAVSFGTLLDGLAIQVALHDADVSPEAASDIAMSYANTALGW